MTSNSRAGLHFRLQPEVVFDGARLVDSLTGHEHEASPLAMQVLWFDSETPGDDAIAQVARDNDTSCIEVERHLRQLLLLGLLEGSCTSARDRLRRLHRGEALEERVLPGSRLGCRGSGACCKGWTFGPVTEQEKAQIEALPVRQRLPYVGEGPWLLPMNAATSRPVYRLSTRGEACVFLDGQLRCGLHAAFGAHAKPAFCQLFPISAVATIDGLKIFDRGQCASFVASARNGAPIEDHLPAIRHLLPQELYHPRVTLDGGLYCDYSLILRLARHIDADIRSMPPGRALGCVGQRIRDFTAALVHCKIVDGQPELAASSALQEPLVEPSFALSPDVDVLQLGLRSFAELTHDLSARTPSHASFAGGLASAAACTASLARASFDSFRERQLQADDAPQVPDSVDYVLTQSIRQQIFGPELILEGSLPAGLLRIICITVFSRLLARSSAAREGRSTVSDVDLGSAHMQITRAMSHPALRECLLQQADRVWAVLDALPALLLAAAN